MIDRKEQEEHISAESCSISDKCDLKPDPALLKQSKATSVGSKQTLKVQKQEEEQLAKSLRTRNKSVKKKTMLEELFEDEAEEGDDDSQENEYNGFTQEAKPPPIAFPERKIQKSWIKDLEGKKEDQIEKFFRQRNYRYVEDGDGVGRSKADPGLFMVKVNKGTQFILVLSMLNKCRKNILSADNKECQIVSAMCRPKKFPGLIFLESYCAQRAKTFLKGFLGIRWDSFEKLTQNQYSNIFKKVHKATQGFQKNNFVRILNGLYEGDLAKIVDIKQTCVKVAVAPRIDTDKLRFTLKKKEDEENYHQGRVMYEWGQINYKRAVPASSRPPKKLITNEDICDLLEKKYGQKLTKEGHFILKYSVQDVNKEIGALQPKEASFFRQQEEGILEFMERQQRNFIRNHQIRVGQLIQSIAGETIGLKGVVKRIEGRLAVFDAYKDGKFVGQIKQPIEKLSPVFKEGEEVIVESGADKGKEGIVLAVQGQKTVILTKNDHQIRVLTKVLIRKNGINSIPSEPSTITFQKYDMLRFNGEVGVAISWNAEFVKVMNEENHIKTIHPIEIDQIVNTRINFALNNFNEKITCQSTVTVALKDKSVNLCEVKHVHKQTIFVYNTCFFEGQGIRAVKINNCRLQSGGWQLGKPKRTDPAMRKQFKVGKVFKITQGLHKGYDGTVMKVIGDEVRLRLMANGKVVDLPFASIGIREVFEQSKQIEVPIVKDYTIDEQEPKYIYKTPEIDRQLARILDM